MKPAVVAFWSAALTRVTRFISKLSLFAQVALWLVRVAALMVMAVPSSLIVMPAGGCEVRGGRGQPGPKYRKSCFC